MSDDHEITLLLVPVALYRPISTRPGLHHRSLFIRFFGEQLAQPIQPPLPKQSAMGPWGAGDGQALDRLMPLVYSELKHVAAAYLNGECQDHTLQPTALVHEAYLKLVQG